MKDFITTYTIVEPIIKEIIPAICELFSNSKESEKIITNLKNIAQLTKCIGHEIENGSICECRLTEIDKYIAMVNNMLYLTNKKLYKLNRRKLKTKKKVKLIEVYNDLLIQLCMLNNVLSLTYQAGNRVLLEIDNEK